MSVGRAGVLSRLCLWSELLLHFRSDWFQSWHVSSLGSVDVRDTFFVTVMFFLTELSALDICIYALLFAI